MPKQELVGRTVINDSSIIRMGRKTINSGITQQHLERSAVEETDPLKRIGRHGTVPVHNGRYDFNDDLLPIGAGGFAWLVEQALSGA